MKNIIRISFLFSVFIFLSLFSSSQVYIKGMSWRPTGELGFLFEKSIAFEIGFKDEFTTNHFRKRFGIGFIKSHPRLKAFPINSYGYTSQGFVIYPALESIEKYNFTQFSIGLDYAPYLKGKLKPYLGFDISISAISTEISVVSPIVKSTNTDSNAAISLRGRFGIEYNLNSKNDLFIETQRQYGLIVQSMYYSANDFSIGITHKIK